VQVSIATSMIQLAWVRYQKSSIGEMHLWSWLETAVIRK
jgi:hypothetical protein